MLPLRLRDGSVGNALKLGGGTALGQAIGAAATPAITRLYSPSDIGLVGLLVSFVTFASVGLALRYDIAIVTALDDVEADALLTASLTFTVLVAAVASALLAVCVATNTLSYGLLPAWSIAVAFVMLVLIGASSALRFWYVRLGAFGPISRALIAQGAGRASVSVGAGLLHAGWVGLLMGEVAGRGLGVLRLARGAAPSVRQAFRRRQRDVRTALARNRKYPLVLLPSSLIDNAASMLAVPVVVSLYGQGNGGEFFLVQSVVGLPAVLVANSVADVLHSRLAAAFLSDTTGLAAIMRLALVRLTAIAFAVYVPIAAAAPFVVPPLLGARWTNAGVIASLLAPVVVSGLIANPLSRVLVVVDRPEWKLGVDVIRLIVPAAALYVCHAAGWRFLPALGAFSVAAAAANCVYIIVVLRAGRAPTHPSMRLRA